MLTSAREQYAEQQKINAAGLTQARRTAPQGEVAVASVVAQYQLASAANTYAATPAILAEQALDAPPTGRASLSALLTAPSAVVRMLAKADSPVAFDRLILTLIQDAGRTAASVDLGRRPALTGHVRSLNPPSCSRCAVLAGRVYRYSDGFQRHPGCDCLMTPTTQAAGMDLITDPSDLIAAGQVRGLSKGDREALENGADLGQVVNVRRRKAGLVQGSSVIERGGRLTPQGIQRLATDRAHAVELLRTHGYIT